MGTLPIAMVGCSEIGCGSTGDCLRDVVDLEMFSNDILIS